MLEMYKGVANSPETTITNNINESDTLIYVLDETRVPEPPNLMVLGTGVSAETIKVISIDGNALTVERGFQGVPRSWNAGTVIARNFTEYDYNALVENVKTLKGNTDTNADDILDLMSYVGDLENLDTTEKANLVLALNETYQELAAHKAESASKHITESGSNENGMYIKFDDGTLICTMTKSINYQTSAQSVQFVYPSSMRYYGSRRHANKNVAFSISSTNAYDGAGEGEVDYVYITHFNVTHKNDGTGCTVQVKYDRDTSTRETDLMVMAIGRWK